jgi:hypothetical protein
LFYNYFNAPTGFTVVGWFCSSMALEQHSAYHQLVSLTIFMLLCLGDCACAALTYSGSNSDVVNKIVNRYYRNLIDRIWAWQYKWAFSHLHHWSMFALWYSV